jgi:TetR/AcrR family transcriptional regulator, transcriptional repressor of bet genes
MGRPSNTIQRQQEIIDGLLVVMSEKGYEKASIQAIANAADMLPGLIHYHFKSKQDILLSLVSQLTESRKERYEVLSGVATNTQERLGAFIESRLNMDDESVSNFVPTWVMICSEAAKQKEVKVIYQQSIEEQLDLLQGLLLDAAIENGQTFTVRRARGLAAAALSLIEGAYTISIAAGDVLPENYAVGQLKAMLALRLGYR